MPSACAEAENRRRTSSGGPGFTTGGSGGGGGGGSGWFGGGGSGGNAPRRPMGRINHQRLPTKHTPTLVSSDTHAAQPTFSCNRVDELPSKRMRLSPRPCAAVVSCGGACHTGLQQGSARQAHHQQHEQQPKQQRPREKSQRENKHKQARRAAQAPRLETVEPA